MSGFGSNPDSLAESFAASQNRVADLETLLQTLQHNAAIANSTERSLRSDIKHLKAALQSRQQQQQTLADEVQQARQEVTTVQADSGIACSVLLAQITCLQTALRLQRSLRDRTQQQADAVAAQLQTVQAERDTALERAAASGAAGIAVQAQLQQTAAALSVSQASDKAKSQQLRRAEAQSQKASAQLTSVQAARDVAEARSFELEQAHQLVGSDLTTVQSDLAEHKQALVASQAEKALATQQHEQLVTKASQLHQELHTAKSDLSSARQQLSQSAQALLDSQAEQAQTLERLKRSDSKVLQLQAQLDKALADKQLAFGNASELRVTLEQVTELQSTLKTTQQELQTAQIAGKTLAEGKSQLESSAAELTERLQSTEGKFQTASELATTRQNLLADAQAQLETVTATQEASAVRVTELQQLLQQVQSDRSTLQQQRTAVQSQLHSKSAEHDTALKTTKELQLELDSIKASAKAAAEQADIRAQQHAAAAAAFKKDLAAERASVKELRHKSQRQQQKSSSSFQQLQAELTDAQKSARAQAQETDAATAKIANLHAKLAAQDSALQIELQNSQRDHDEVVQGLQSCQSEREKSLQDLQMELKKVREAAAVSEEKAGAAAKSQEFATAALRHEISHLQQQLTAAQVWYTF